MSTLGIDTQSGEQAHQRLLDHSVRQSVAMSKSNASNHVLLSLLADAKQACVDARKQIFQPTNRPKRSTAHYTNTHATIESTTKMHPRLHMKPTRTSCLEGTQSVCDKLEPRTSRKTILGNRIVIQRILEC
eukprot:6208048-Pleurochrysis_carterae.AAC.3